jgi:uncharacterized repeat protein (TIGR01451 family)
VWSDRLCFAQENSAAKSLVPAVELLTLNGSKPSLTADGEGITSFKARHLYKLGPTRVKPFDSNFKIELPTGYTLFNNMAYVIDSEAIFSGPNDLAVRVPSSATTESFEKLKILYAERDDAEPEKPVWVDATLLPSLAEYWKSYLSQTEFEERLPNFKTRTLHAFLPNGPGVLVVASKDSTVSRDGFVADLRMTATATPESVMEGREITYSFEITNNGPDTATGVSFHSHVDPEFVSLTQSQGKCRLEAHNIYCNLGELQKGARATIIYHGTCRWNFYIGDQPVQSGGLQSQPKVNSAEGDPNYENNHLFMSTPVKKDPNQSPVVVILKPQDNEFLDGREAIVNIVSNAYDEDGSISKVEFFDQGKSIGTGKLTGKDTYELAYHNLALGRHLLQAEATDNQGHPQSSGYAGFIVNGPAQIQILEPQRNFVKNPPHDLFSVTVRASNPKGIKKVVVYLSAGFGSHSTQIAQSVGNDEYTATFKDLTRECGAGLCYVSAVATDEAGIESTSTVQFRVNRAPEVSLSLLRGNVVNHLQDGAEFESDAAIGLTAKASDFLKDGIAKVDFYANGLLIGTEKNEMDASKSYQWKAFDITWKPKPGTYILTAVAVDVYGAAGKSTPVQVVIKDRQR